MGKKVRDSNIEMLRILAMLLIVAAHGTVRICTGESSFRFNAVVQALGSWGILGVDLFLAISAWFLVDQKFRIRKVIDIVWTTFTWVAGFSVLSVVYVYRETGNFSVAMADYGDWLFRMLKEPLWAYCYWFVTAYFFMLLASPLMNKAIHSLPKESLKKALLILLFIPIYTQFAFNVTGDILYFCYVYLLMGYLKRHGIRWLERLARPAVFLTLSAAIIITRSFLYFPSLCYSIPGELLKITIAAAGRHAMVMLLDALLIFLWVVRCKPHYNRIVNGVAACTFGVYLFHSNVVASFPMMVNWLFERYVQWKLITFTKWFPLQFGLMVLLTFAMGAALEYIRQQVLQKPMMKLLDKRCSKQMEKVDEWFNSL